MFPIQELERLSNVQSDRGMTEKLAKESQMLHNIQNPTIDIMRELVEDLKESVYFLSAVASNLQAQINDMETKVRLVETTLPIDVHKILRKELACFVRKEVGYISLYLNWLRDVLIGDVTSCQPLATGLDNGRVILCDRIVDPWNAFWFSLGCCTFFLIPSIIFAIKTTKHLRPIRHRLISTGSEETYPFHIPRVTSLKL
uniref:Uncharacterized protein n=1 Tax=Sphaerodactylus townsendi TaxID=933632 RepID=A0ACB8EYV9_9SAUR